MAENGTFRKFSQHSNKKEENGNKFKTGINCLEEEGEIEDEAEERPEYSESSNKISNECYSKLTRESILLKRSR